MLAMTFPYLMCFSIRRIKRRDDEEMPGSVNLRIVERKQPISPLNFRNCYHDIVFGQIQEDGRVQSVDVGSNDFEVVRSGKSTVMVRHIGSNSLDVVCKFAKLNPRVAIL